MILCQILVDAEVMKRCRRGRANAAKRKAHAVAVNLNLQVRAAAEAMARKNTNTRTRLLILILQIRFQKLILRRFKWEVLAPRAALAVDQKSLR